MVVCNTLLCVMLRYCFYVKTSGAFHADPLEIRDDGIESFRSSFDTKNVTMTRKRHAAIQKEYVPHHQYRTGFGYNYFCQ
jgi:hypothetical protein